VVAVATAPHPLSDGAGLSLRLQAPSSTIEENHCDPLAISSIEEQSQGA